MEAENNDNTQNETENMNENGNNPEIEANEEENEGFSFDIIADVDKDEPTVTDTLNLLENLLYPGGQSYIEAGEEGIEHIRSFPLLSDRFDYIEPLIELTQHAREHYEIENFELQYYNEVSENYFDVVIEAPLYEDGEFKYDLEIQAAILNAEGTRVIEFQDVRFDR
ncbi:hypothetical protein BBEV_0830 [Salisediminibacterium beveridgei]|uniref:Uncharacterized protein n=2 Tax=Salisediminibacterium beveridgei TaxID=632773 RepID=A0A1D7QT72_9BACI|nr:hypothetical protein BBEV_0830 [Salisediminibacterium beveridgei]